MEESQLQSILRVSDFSPTSLPELLDYALDEILKLTASRLGCIYYYSEATGKFTLHAWSKGVLKEGSVQNQQTVDQLLKTGIWGEVVRQRRPILLNADTPLKQDGPAGHAQLERFLSIPVFSGGEVVAAAGVANKPNDYTERDLENLTQTMDVIWRLAERFEEQRTLQRLNRSYRALGESIRARADAQSEDELLSRVVNIVKERCHYQFVWIGFRKNDRQKTVRPVTCSGNAEKYLTGVEVSWGEGPLGQGAVGKAIRSGQAQVIDNVAEDPDFAPWCDRVLTLGFTSVAAFPLLKRRRAFGALVVYLKGGELFTPDEVQLLGEIADDLASGIQLLRERAKRAKAQEQLVKLSMAIEQSPVSVMITDSQGRIEYVNPHFTKMTGYAAEEALGRDPNFLQTDKTPKQRFEKMWQELLSGHSWAGEFINKTKAGEEFIEHAQIAPIMNKRGEITHFVCVNEDVTRRKQLERKLAHMAHYDQLTNLPNRTFFYDRIKQSISLADRQQTLCALLFLDLNRFKQINDRFGHEIGDALLRACAERLVEAVRETDTVARIGGDEFIVVSPLASDPSHAGILAEKLLAALTRPFLIRTHRCEIGASIGISIFPHDGSDVSTLLRKADSAMYQAKRQGQSAFTYYAGENPSEPSE